MLLTQHELNTHMTYEIQRNLTEYDDHNGDDADDDYGGGGGGGD